MSEERGAQARFGTFGGVFTPCVLTILGVIMFMRSGYVVGQSGVWQAILILVISKAITTFTTLSLAAIATNTEVRTGGVYYMISRTLGADFGGAIGITLFVSQAVSIAFYVIGFTEALFRMLPEDTAASLMSWRFHQIVSSVVVIGLFAVTFKGADLAIRAQYFILGILLLSVAAFMLGGLVGFSSDTFASNSSAAEQGDSFWVVFAIFFPAATGITAGANMSGDLKDPGKSIPSGTLLAIAFTGAIYLLQLVLMAGNASQAELSNDPFGSLKQMSLFGPLVAAGVFAATLSSALGSFLGAPRILQAMGQDRLLAPLEYFAVGHGPENEPRRAAVLSLAIALAVVWAGSLNVVAPVISMFFLIAYGMINLSAFVEGRGGNPSFRPRFKMFGWPAALGGAIGCTIAMIKIDETYALIAIAIAALIYMWLRGRVTTSDWGDAKRGYIFARTRQNLLALERSKPDPKNWRPVLAVLTRDAVKDLQLISCGSWLESGRGLFSVLELYGHTPKDADELVTVRDARVKSIHDFLHSRSIIGFADSVVLSPDDEPIEAVLQAYSIGSLRPNIALVPFPSGDDPDERQRTARTVALLADFGLSLTIFKWDRAAITTSRARIDVWWGGQRNGSLLALLAYLVSQHPEWRKARIRMLQVVPTGADHLQAEDKLRKLVDAARLTVDVQVILSQQPVGEIIAETSRGSDLVLLGMARKDLSNFNAFVEARGPLLAGLPPTLLVWSNGEADLLA